VLSAQSINQSINQFLPLHAI